MSPKKVTALAILGLLLSVAAPAAGAEKVPAEPARVERTPPTPTQSPTHDGTTPEQAVVVPWKGAVVDMSRDPMPIVVGPLVVGAFHIFPALEPGPYIGPPARIWGLGFGTSLWRDPVTGWPLQ